MIYISADAAARRIAREAKAKQVCTKLYKLTDANGPESGLQWGPEVTYRAGDMGVKYLYAYTHPIFAALMNPFPRPVLWLAEGCAVEFDGLEAKCKSLAAINPVSMPKLTTEYCIEVAIRAAATVYGNWAFQHWADWWLSGADRSREAAKAAHRAIFFGPQPDNAAASAALYATVCAYAEPDDKAHLMVCDPTAHTAACALEATLCVPNVYKYLDISAILKATAERHGIHYEE